MYYTECVGKSQNKISRCGYNGDNIHVLHRTDECPDFITPDFKGKVYNNI